MNTLTIAGRLGKDAIIRHLHDGTAVASFSVAVDKRTPGEKIPLWVDCRLWRERAQKLAPYLLKGTPVCVTGEADVHAFEGKAYLSLSVANLTFLGSKDRTNDVMPPSSAPKARAVEGEVIPF